MMVLFASALAVSVYTNLDTVMLGFICDDREVGLYTVAVKVKTVLLAVVNAISTVLFPRLSCYYGQEKYGEYYKVLKKSVSVIFMLTIPLAMFLRWKHIIVFFILGGRLSAGSVLYANIDACSCNIRIFKCNRQSGVNPTRKRYIIYESCYGWGIC